MTKITPNALFAPWSLTAPSAPTAVKSKPPKPPLLQPPGPSQRPSESGKATFQKKSSSKVSTCNYSSKSTSLMSSTTGAAASMTTPGIASSTTKTRTETPSLATKPGIPAPSLATAKIQGTGAPTTRFMMQQLITRLPARHTMCAPVMPSLTSMMI